MEFMFPSVALLAFVLAGFILVIGILALLDASRMVRNADAEYDNAIASLDRSIAILQEAKETREDAQDMRNRAIELYEAVTAKLSLAGEPQ